MMDRDRLKQVHQTELTESRINEEFLEWLKAKGPSWLLLILVAVGAYMAVLRWKQHKSSHFEQGWVALLECRLPGAFEDVAAQYADIPGLPQQAKRQAADALLRAVQAGRPLGTDLLSSPISSDPQLSLTDQQRQEYLARADQLFQDVIETDDQSLAMTLHAVSALNGRAAVAEASGDVEQARQWYVQAAQRAEAYYPHLAERARDRAATADQYAQAVSLPTQQQLPDRPEPESLKPVTIEDVLRDVLLPDEAGNG